MATTKGTSLVSQVRGKVGDQIFYMHGLTQCVKAMPHTIADPKSAKQQTIRNQLASWSVNWTDGTLEDLEKYLWDNYARQHGLPTVPPSGIPGYPHRPRCIPSGELCYAWTNIMLTLCGFANVRVPPNTSVAYVDGFNLTAVNYIEPALTIQWNPTAGFLNGQKVLATLQCTNTGFHRQLTPPVLGTTGSMVILNVTAQKGFTVALQSIKPCHIHVNLRYVDSSGYVSPISNMIDVYKT